MPALARAVLFSIPLLAGALAARADPAETVIANFAGAPDPAHPLGALLRDSKGNLYGTSAYGGFLTRHNLTQGAGTVFKLTPPIPGETVWNERILYRFGSQGADGAVPEAAPSMGAFGYLILTTAAT